MDFANAFPWISEIIFNFCKWKIHFRKLKIFQFLEMDFQFLEMDFQFLEIQLQKLEIQFRFADAFLCILQMRFRFWKRISLNLSKEF
jgi:hypothetical protein